MTEQRGQQIIVCKKCGSNKVNRVHVAIALFLSAGCFMWIPILGWICAPICLLLGLITMFGRIVFKCEECKHNFAVNKNMYKEYKSYLNS